MRKKKSMPLLVGFKPATTNTQDERLTVNLRSTVTGESINKSTVGREHLPKLDLNLNTYLFSRGILHCSF